jgi:hypothetical protein
MLLNISIVKPHFIMLKIKRKTATFAHPKSGQRT